MALVLTPAAPPPVAPPPVAPPAHAPPAATLRAPVAAPGIADWARQLGSPRAESSRSRRLAHVGGLVALFALVAYLTWRIAFTLPASGANRSIALALIAFEALPLGGLLLKSLTLWNIDSEAPPPVTSTGGRKVVVLIPTYNEPLEVIAPTIAASCTLEPEHETWVLDDGDRPWVAEMCASMGARYVNRPVHDHAKAGNLNHALDLLDAEARAGTGGADIVAVLDCDHVPLPTFLTATLGWFDDETVGLVQGPQAFYNAGAFDDDGFSGEQGLFFNVLMPARHSAGAGPFWCGSTSLVRVDALRDVGGVATETITEDMHTTLKMQRRGWNTRYHHQTLAVGLAPDTPGQYLLQRRRWGLGAMQILVHERLWAAKRWMTWRNFYEYLNGTMWWLEGVASVATFAVPITILLSGAETSTAAPAVFTAAFLAMFCARLWGSKRLLRGNIRWTSAFALRVFRVPVGIACAWWLVTRRSLEFEVTPKGADDERRRGRAPLVLWLMVAVALSVIGYAAAGVAGLVPWSASPRATLASSSWLLVGTAVLIAGSRRIRAAQFATSRRNSHRVRVDADVLLDGVPGRLLDISVGGARVQVPRGVVGAGSVLMELPGAAAVAMQRVRGTMPEVGDEIVSLQVRNDDWRAFATLSRWMFHTPAGAVPCLPDGVPVVACRATAS